MIHKGLLVSVFRAAHGQDCTNNGVSSRFNTLIAASIYVGEIPEVFPSLPDSSNVVIVAYRGQFKDWVAYPVTPDGEILTRGMFGGNFIYTSDSRLAEFTGFSLAPIPVFDRFE